MLISAEISLEYYDLGLDINNKLLIDLSTIECAHLRNNSNSNSNNNNSNNTKIKRQYGFQ